MNDIDFEWYMGRSSIRHYLAHTISLASCLRRFWFLPLPPGVEWLDEAFRNIGRFGWDIVVTLLLDSWKAGNRSFELSGWEITGGVIGVCVPEASLYNINSISQFSFPMFRRNVINSVWEREAHSLPLADINLSPGLIRPSDRAGSLTKALMVWRRTVDSSVWHNVNPRLPFIWMKNENNVFR